MLLIDNNDTGWQFCINCLFPFWWPGTIFDLFQLSGKLPEFKELRNIIGNGSKILEPQIFIIRAEMLSWQWTFLMSKARMIFDTSLYRNCSITQTFCLSRYRAIIFNRCTLFSKVQVEKISLFPKISYELVVYYEWWN